MAAPSLSIDDPQAVAAFLETEAHAATFRTDVTSHLRSVLGDEAVEDASLADYALVLLRNKRTFAQLHEAMNELLAEDDTATGFMVFLRGWLKAQFAPPPPAPAAPAGPSGALFSRAMGSLHPAPRSSPAPPPQQPRAAPAANLAPIVVTKRPSGSSSISRLGGFKRGRDAHEDAEEEEDDEGVGGTPYPAGANEVDDAAGSYRGSDATGSYRGSSVRGSFRARGARGAFRGGRGAAAAAFAMQASQQQEFFQAAIMQAAAAAAAALMRGRGRGGLRGVRGSIRGATRGRGAAAAAAAGGGGPPPMPPSSRVYVNPSTVDCRYGSACFNRGMCKFKHPEGVAAPMRKSTKFGGGGDAAAE